LVYAQSTTEQSTVGHIKQGRSYARRHRRHRRGPRARSSRLRRSPRTLNPQPLPPE
jgi:hypothetical protein